MTHGIHHECHVGLVVEQVGRQQGLFSARFQMVQYILAITTLSSQIVSFLLMGIPSETRVRQRRRPEVYDVYLRSSSAYFGQFVISLLLYQ